MRTHSTISLVLAAITAAGCDHDVLPTIPSTSSVLATIHITVSTTGPDLDADGYTVLVDRIRRQPVGVNDTLTLIVATGTHTVALDGVAGNCTLADSNPRTVSVASNDTVAVAFAAVCGAFGNVQVTVATTGTDADPNGYVVRLSEAVHYWKPFLEHLVPTSGSATLHGIPSREYVLRLRGVAANCEVSDVNTRTVNVLGGDTVPVTFDVACKPVTQLLYVRGAEPDIYLINSNGTGPVRLAAFATDPAWSPDGSRIAYTSYRNGSREISVMQADGSSPQRLTAGGSDYRPAWSPDGTRIVFVRGREADAELYVMNADGTGQARLTNNAAKDTEPAWSPDGSSIAFTSTREAKPWIYVMNADGSAVVRVSTNASAEDENPAWSPDGTRLAFSRRLCPISAGCSQEIYVMNANGTGATLVGDGGIEPAWSPDGRQIAYTGIMCEAYYYFYSYCHANGIRIAHAAGGDAVEVTTLPVDSRPAWRP